MQAANWTRPGPRRHATSTSTFAYQSPQMMPHSVEYTTAGGYARDFLIDPRYMPSPPPLKPLDYDYLPVQWPPEYTPYMDTYAYAPPPDECGPPAVQYLEPQPYARQVPWPQWAPPPTEAPPQRLLSRSPQGRTQVYSSDAPHRNFQGRPHSVLRRMVLSREPLSQTDPQNPAQSAYPADQPPFPADPAGRGDPRGDPRGPPHVREVDQTHHLAPRDALLRPHQFTVPAHMRSPVRAPLGRTGQMELGAADPAAIEAGQQMVAPSMEAPQMLHPNLRESMMSEINRPEHFTATVASVNQADILGPSHYQPVEMMPPPRAVALSPQQTAAPSVWGVRSRPRSEGPTSSSLSMRRAQGRAPSAGLRPFGNRVLPSAEFLRNSARAEINGLMPASDVLNPQLVGRKPRGRVPGRHIATTDLMSMSPPLTNMHPSMAPLVPPLSMAHCPSVNVHSTKLPESRSAGPPTKPLQSGVMSSNTLMPPGMMSSAMIPQSLMTSEIRSNPAMPSALLPTSATLHSLPGSHALISPPNSAAYAKKPAHSAIQNVVSRRNKNDLSNEGSVRTSTKVSSPKSKPRNAEGRGSDGRNGEGRNGEARTTSDTRKTDARSDSRTGDSLRNSTSRPSAQSSSAFRSGIQQVRSGRLKAPRQAAAHNLSATADAVSELIAQAEEERDASPLLAQIKSAVTELASACREIARQQSRPETSESEPSVNTDPKISPRTLDQLTAQVSQNVVSKVLDSLARHLQPAPVEDASRALGWTAMHRRVHSVAGRRTHDDMQSSDSSAKPDVQTYGGTSHSGGAGWLLPRSVQGGGESQMQGSVRDGLRESRYYSHNGTHMRDLETTEPSDLEPIELEHSELEEQRESVQEPSSLKILKIGAAPAERYTPDECPESPDLDTEISEELEIPRSPRRSSPLNDRGSLRSHDGRSHERHKYPEKRNVSSAAAVRGGSKPTVHSSSMEPANGLVPPEDSSEKGKSPTSRFEGLRDVLFTLRIDTFQDDAKKTAKWAPQTRQVDVIRIHKSPDLFIMPDLLTTSETQHILSDVPLQWLDEPAPGAVVTATNEDAYGHVMSGRPESARGGLVSLCRLKRGVTPCLARLERRLAAASQCPLSCLEEVLLMRFSPGAYLGAYLESSAYYKTILIFLNGLKGSGGDVTFTRLGLQIKPRRGTALMWQNTDENGVALRQMLHSHKPADQDHKLLLVCQFQLPPPL